VVLVTTLCVGMGNSQRSAQAQASPRQVAQAKATTIYAARATTMVTRAPRGARVASLDVAAPLQVTAKHGAWATVLFSAWVRAGGGQILYVDTGAVGSAIRGGQVAAALPKPMLTKTNKDTGVTWEKVLLAGVVKIEDTVTSQNILWKPAKVYYTASCGVCHALHAPGQFTSERWPANIKAMAHNTALTPSQIDLVLKYLQWHASDMPHSGS
jgi:trimethylamine-N-oxide reductase cytochrome c-type subunit TorC